MSNKEVPRKYQDDTVFQKIEKKFLSLSDEEIKVNNEHLKTYLENSFIPLLKKDELFAALFQKIIYGGSFYKGTRYGKPEEFDLDLVIKLPIDYTRMEVDTNHGNYGFIKIKVNMEPPMSPTWIKYAKTLSKWITAEGYLDQNKFRYWMESIFTLAFSSLTRTANGYEDLSSGKNYTINHKKSGPAFTLNITTPEKCKIDIDLVPCLEFDNVPLGNGYRNLNGNKKTWMAMAKPLQSATDSNVLWRICFYEQEKELLTGNLEGNLKPIIRMMKKFRDTMEWKNIASYYIETILLHVLEKYKKELEIILKAPKIFLFVMALKKLQIYLEKGELPYFWHPKCNLFSKINSAELIGYASRLKKIIKNIDDNILNDRYVLADVVLTSDEALLIRMENQLESGFQLVPGPQDVPEYDTENNDSCVIA